MLAKVPISLKIGSPLGPHFEQNWHLGAVVTGEDHDNDDNGDGDGHDNEKEEDVDHDHSRSGATKFSAQ